MAAVAGHMCLLSPPQRGTMMGLNKPGMFDVFTSLLANSLSIYQLLKEVIVITFEVV